MTGSDKPLIEPVPGRIVAGPGMQPHLRTKIRKWVFTVRYWPVAGATFSQVQLMTWKGWDSWLWAAPFLVCLYLVIASLTRGEKAVKELAELQEAVKGFRAQNAQRAVFTCQDCGLVLYPEGLVRPVRAGSGMVVCPNCHATVSP